METNHILRVITETQPGLKVDLQAVLEGLRHNIDALSALHAEAIRNEQHRDELVRAGIRVRSLIEGIKQMLGEE